MADRNERPDLEPGFWSEYTPPATYVGAAIQYPLDNRFADRMIMAYVKDAAAARKGKK